MSNLMRSSNNISIIYNIFYLVIMLAQKSIVEPNGRMDRCPAPCPYLPQLRGEIAARVFMNGPDEGESKTKQGKMPPAVDLVPYSLFLSPGKNSLPRHSFSPSPNVR